MSRRVGTMFIGNVAANALPEGLSFQDSVDQLIVNARRTAKDELLAVFFLMVHMMRHGVHESFLRVTVEFVGRDWGVRLFDNPSALGNDDAPSSDGSVAETYQDLLDVSESGDFTIFRSQRSFGVCDEDESSSDSS
eukprot:TRINITY_DN38657_c0_g1_i1.p1 TRINITY_DN38657_c0_g1~~TRINITY_DN38657_c0_g1_i1.p1  ORF type:complete len:136 (-),score=21.60 TRINITY_DN38657_c0_g1_i1:273-680(-)